MDPFLGEIRPVGFNFAPRGWAMCNGQLMPISQNTALFSLLGTNYGGDGRSTFALPDLRARFPLSAGTSTIGLSPYDVGEIEGEEFVQLVATEIPLHSHVVHALGEGGATNSPAGAVWAQQRFGRATQQAYATAGTTTAMSNVALGSSGQDQPHNNMPPYLVVNFIISLAGVFPQRP
jgi:microcystin-dependent protein